MPHNVYPEFIMYFGQVMTSRISMKPNFKIERKAMRMLPFTHPANIYLSPEKLQEHTLKYSQELQVFVTQNNELVADNEYHFILTCEEIPRLIISTDLHHSSLSNGKKVLASGSLIFKDGCIVAITNNSGHYCPTDDEMLDVIKALYVANSTLKTYISFCTAPTKIYPVNELITSERFNQVTPIDLDEIIDTESGNRVKCSYDFRIGSEKGRDNRYGAVLKEDLSSLYQNLINEGFNFFQPASDNTLSSEPFNAAQFEL